jgi:hypothetical protein
MAINKIQTLPERKEPVTTPQPKQKSEPKPQPEVLSLTKEEVPQVRARITALVEEQGVITQTYSHMPMSQRDLALKDALTVNREEQNTLRAQIQKFEKEELAEKRRLAAKRAKWAEDNLDKALDEAKAKHQTALNTLQDHKNLVKECEKHIGDLRLDRMEAYASSESALDAASSSTDTNTYRKAHIAAQASITAIGFDLSVAEKKLAKLKEAQAPLADVEKECAAALHQIESQMRFAKTKAAIEKCVLLYAKEMSIQPENAALAFSRAVSNAVSAGTLPSGVY